jgi:hypothetical protein
MLQHSPLRPGGADATRHWPVIAQGIRSHANKIPHAAKRCRRAPAAKPAATLQPKRIFDQNQHWVDYLAENALQKSEQ